MKHRIPDGDCGIITVDFPENFRSIYKTINDNLQGLRKGNPEPDFDHAWQKEKNQSEYAEHKGFEIAQHELTDHSRYDEYTQDGEYNKRPSVFSKLFSYFFKEAFPPHAPVQFSDLSFLTSFLIQMKRTPFYISLLYDTLILTPCQIDGGSATHEAFLKSKKVSNIFINILLTYL
jgi:hypothetical protein